ncbi:MAG: methyltransferase domain-containing protein [Bdellovibrionales bacterium]|nr:methyltransferase domain-containing protein [Bdellovibrionales bacterium]
MPNIKGVSQIYRALLAVSIAGAGAFLAIRFSLALRPQVETADSSLRPGAGNVYQQVTGDDAEEDRSRWDALFSTHTYVFGKDPAEFLKKHVELLPVGRALDIAMGEGRNAVYLAQKGFQVDGVDISDVALRKARRLAREHNVPIRAINADLRDYVIQPGAYEVILDIQYLQRSLIPQIQRGLKPGGVVVFENHTVDQLRNPDGHGIPRDYLLEQGELRRLFADLEVLVYEEVNDGKDAVARLIARRPN